MSKQTEEREIFSPLHHRIAACLGYRQTPTYASWDKVEATAPVQEVDRLVQLVDHERKTAADEAVQEAKTEWLNDVIYRLEWALLDKRHKTKHFRQDSVIHALQVLTDYQKERDLLSNQERGE